MLKILDLCSGIGGFSLGLERTGGFRTVAFCESDPFCRKVLNKHWPGVPIYDDIRALSQQRLKADGIKADVVTAGWPCQDISVAGKGKGLGGQLSRLWFAVAQIIGEVRPRWVLLENVAALKSRGLDHVLGTLAALGYDAEWNCIPASAVGAPHRRDRIWIVAYPHGRRQQGVRLAQHAHEQGSCAVSQDVWSLEGWLPDGPANDGADMADSHFTRLEGRRCPQLPEHSGKRPAGTGSPYIPDTESLQRQEQWRCPSRGHVPGDGPAESGNQRWGQSDPGWWLIESGMGRVAHGVPNRVDRLRSLGNSLVPQIPEILGRAILDIEYEGYDPQDDMTRSLAEGYRAIRERMADGVPPWVPR